MRLTRSDASQRTARVKASPPIPALRRDLEILPRDDGTVDVRDPKLLQIFTIDGEDFRLAQAFDGRGDAKAVAAKLNGASTAAARRAVAKRVTEVAEELDEIFLLDTPKVKKAKAVVENTAPYSQIDSNTKRLNVLPVAESEARWSCHACGACCHGLVVEISAEEEARIDPELYRDILGDRHFAEDSFIDPDQPAKRVLRQVRDDRGACVFLSPEGLCNVHARQGMAAKPDACQIFPHMVLTVPKGPPRLGIRVNCESMYKSVETGTRVQDNVQDVLRILETSPSHKLGRTLRCFGRMVPFAKVDALAQGMRDTFAVHGLGPEGLAIYDRDFLGGRAAAGRREVGKGLWKYVRDEQKSEIPVDEGAYWEQVKRLDRGMEALAAMKAGRRPPKVNKPVEAFLRAQVNHVLYLLGPTNLPDAGLGFVTFTLLLEAMLHAIGPRGRQRTANTAFMVFTAPLLETTTHAWPILDALDPRYAQRLRKEL